MSMKVLIPPNFDKKYISEANAMWERGGSFAKHLGRAYLSADHLNFPKLESAFEDLFLTYKTK